jgi:hypothetical protein
MHRHQSMEHQSLHACFPHSAGYIHSYVTKDILCLKELDRTDARSVTSGLVFYIVVTPAAGQGS